jgi:subtilisin family serine protease
MKAVARVFSASVVLVLVLVTQGFAQQGRYIVKFRDGRGPAGQAAVRAAGAQVVLTLGPQNAVAASIPAAAVAGLSRNPNIEYIEEDVIRQPYALWSNVSSHGDEVLPYGIQLVQADLVSSPNASDVRLCIIDSGYSDQHEDLRDFTGTDLTAKQTDSGSGTWNKDSCGHGTHVAGTVAAIANRTGVVGANPDTSLHIVKVFGDDDLVENGACGWTYSSTLVSALNSCVTAGSKVVSMSLGGSARSRTEEKAFADAYANDGVLSIAAAGNAGNGGTSYPAGYASVVSVAAVDANEQAPSFSQHNRDIELAAPGVGVLSTVPYLDSNVLQAGRQSWSGGRMEGAARGSASGVLIDGGLCTSAGAWAGMVVVCQRGDITFADKVKNVQAGGGVAAAIYNNVASDPSCGVFLGTLGDRVTTNIPAIALSCDDGAAALTKAGNLGTVSSSFLAPDSGYESWDGTSMATPHVSAVAALVWSCHPELTAKQLRDALDSSARDKGAAGRDIVYGFGIVQAKGALQLLGPGSCTVK